ncbi:hypothetical protein Y032_0022g502 [Ancylostoma ceylanicum]|uniref:Uncharacterized protein n=1 Tax=Ancylostoma ceylanicum TaxID=53326 RepID=A0A016V0D2_9BILA|nr:hypothetical protein Y032_0022g502 [Ancylostoma ceylanicum]
MFITHRRGRVTAFIARLSSPLRSARLARWPESLPGPEGDVLSACAGGGVGCVCACVCVCVRGVAGRFYVEISALH